MAYLSEIKCYECLNCVSGDPGKDYQVKGFVQARDTRGAKIQSDCPVRVPPKYFSNEEIANVTDHIRELLIQNNVFESVGRYY